MKSKKIKNKYGLGGELLMTGLQLGGNALFPGLGTALGAIAGNEMQNMEQSKIMQQHYNNVEATSNPYQLYQNGGHLMTYNSYSKNKKMTKGQVMQKLQLGGFIDGALDNFQYKGNTHAQGGINVTDRGIPVSSSNKEVEADEVTIKLKGKPSYVFSRRLKI